MEKELNLNILTPIDENYPLLENATPDQVDENISNGAVLFNSLFDDLEEKNENSETRSSRRQHQLLTIAF